MIVTARDGGIRPAVTKPTPTKRGFRAAPLAERTAKKELKSGILAVEAVVFFRNATIISSKEATANSIRYGEVYGSGVDILHHFAKKRKLI